MVSRPSHCTSRNELTYVLWTIVHIPTVYRSCIYSLDVACTIPSTRKYSPIPTIQLSFSVPTIQNWFLIPYVQISFAIPCTRFSFTIPSIQNWFLILSLPISFQFDLVQISFWIGLDASYRPNTSDLRAIRD